MASLPLLLLLLQLFVGGSRVCGERVVLKRDVDVVDSYRLARSFATKTVYWNQRDGVESEAKPSPWEDLATTLLQSELQLVQTHVVMRHGIRYPTAGNIKQTLALLAKLRPYEAQTPAWLRNYSLPYNLSVEGELAQRGEREMEKLARRLLHAHGKIQPVVFSNASYRVAHTYKKRTKDSAIAFARKYFSNPAQVQLIEFPKNRDPLLRFYDECPRYQQTVKLNQTSIEQFSLFEKSPAMQKNAQRMQKALNVPLELTAKDAGAIYGACAFDFALYDSTDQWCSLVADPVARSMDFLGDLKAFYQLAGGYPINYEMASVLLQSVFDQLKAGINGTSSVAAYLYFAHAETTLPLMTLLGYNERTELRAAFSPHEIRARGFRTSVTAPFAANIEFRLYRRKVNASEHFVQVLVNEREAPIPGCGHSICEIAVLERLWSDYLEGYNFQKACAYSAEGEEEMQVQ